MSPRSCAIAGRVAHPAATVFLFACALLILMLQAGVASASFVRPLESKGEIAAVLDVHDRPRDDGGMDIVLLLAVPNRELAFQEELGGRMSGRIVVNVDVYQPDSPVSSRHEELIVTAGSLEASYSGIAQQVFSLLIENVVAPYATIICTLDDVTATRIVNRDEAPRPPRASLRGEWVSPPDIDDVVGLYLHAPVFVAGAPLGLLPPGLEDLPPLQNQLISDHLHPTRRYGLEQDLLQVIFDVEAATRGSEAPRVLPRSLMIQVLAKELDLAHRDTIVVMDDPHAFIAAGGHATVSWELDVSDLPPGSYQLSCAPLDGLGNAWVNEFDVIWSMDALTRPRDDLVLTGHLVLPDSELDRFEKSGPVEQEAILGRFWSENDPDPSTRINEAEIEFRERMDYVRRFLGGFGRRQPMDDRGDIFLLLGPPDEIEKQVIPINSESFEDAMAKVYNSYIPIHQGIMDQPVLTESNESIQAQRELHMMITSPEKVKAFELWTYKGSGRSLFPNRYNTMAIGLRFLFLARLSESTYQLESTNAADEGS